jgi:hypothetical protein
MSQMPLMHSAGARQLCPPVQDWPSIATLEQVPAFPCPSTQSALASQSKTPGPPQLWPALANATAVQRFPAQTRPLWAEHESRPWQALSTISICAAQA